MQAAFLSVKLKNLDRWNDDRRRIASRYSNEISNPQIVLPQEMDGTKHVYHIYAVKCDRRDELESYLNALGIGTNKHYPIPMHMQECYKPLHIPKGQLPLAEEISSTILSIPMSYGMSDEEVTFVIDALNQFE